MNCQANEELYQLIVFGYLFSLDIADLLCGNAEWLFCANELPNTTTGLTWAES